VAYKQTFQEGIGTVQLWQRFQWYSCYRMAWNHSTLVSQNFTLMLFLI